ncbi:dTMP kinase [Nocardia amamiensis]|uniref:Thymidylate kinase n=1 Tax=Nocardia amamiensis TaxID=404578 RepID=A0ABS0CXY2_9NOCA|nr:dTMP kinase [Nocardia amamiensis]MBF6301456.1 dTMP kinase [Nocardia amamiensis]
MSHQVQPENADATTGAGMLVTLDGPGGVGKSSISRELVGYLRRRGVRVHATAQPSPTALGDLIRVQADTYRGIALACLVAGDRHHQLANEIVPAIDSGTVVVCDRYLPSSLVLQTLDGVDAQTVWQLNHGVRMPDLAVMLHADVRALTARLSTRGAHDRFERASDSSQIQSDRFHEVAAELAHTGWPVAEFDCTHRRPSDTARAIGKLILPHIQAHHPGTDRHGQSTEQQGSDDDDRTQTSEGSNE